MNVDTVDLVFVCVALGLLLTLFGALLGYEVGRRAERGLQALREMRRRRFERLR